MIADDLAAITFDFGNTLVPVGRAGLRRVVELTGRAVVDRSGPFELEAFLDVWAEERERQFRQEVPRFREVDMEQRVRRVLARLRGMPAPDPDRSWDDDEAASRSSPEDVAFAVTAYSHAFVEAMPPPPAVGPLLDRLSRRTRVGILSNWPLAATIDHYADAAGWRSALTAVVVSQRVGVIKPDPAIFRAAEVALGLGPADGPRILHVGDDWAADIVGASAAGWRTAYLDARPEDTPLPGGPRDDAVTVDLEVESLTDLEAALLPAEVRRPEPSG